MVYFVSPQHRWFCGFSVPDPGSVGCSGAMPSNAPAVTKDFGDHAVVRPNGVRLAHGSPAAFIFTNDSAYLNQEALPLEYGDTLTVGFMTCSVDPHTGVTCSEGQHGFRVSADSYQLS